MLAQRQGTGRPPTLLPTGYGRSGPPTPPNPSGLGGPLPPLGTGRSFTPPNPSGRPGLGGPSRVPTPTPLDARRRRGAPPPFQAYDGSYENDYSASNIDSTSEQSTDLTQYSNIPASRRLRRGNRPSFDQAYNGYSTSNIDSQNFSNNSSSGQSSYLTEIPNTSASRRLRRGNRLPIFSASSRPVLPKPSGLRNKVSTKKRWRCKLNRTKRNAK
jgi:hypothetical protein